MSEALRDAAFRAFIYQTLEARAKQLKDEARAELSAIPVGETVAATHGGCLLAKASMSRGKTKLVVTDPAVFTAWVLLHHPSEVVSTVNPAYVKAIEARAKELGLGAVIDTNGVVVPGVEIQESAPTVSVRKERDLDALTVVGQLLRDGAVSLDGVKAIEAP